MDSAREAGAEAGQLEASPAEAAAIDAAARVSAAIQAREVAVSAREAAVVAREVASATPHHAPTFAEEGEGEGEEDPDAEAPPGWVKLADFATGALYYVHEATGRSQWDRPRVGAPPPPPPPPPPPAVSLSSSMPEATGPAEAAETAELPEPCGRIPLDEAFGSGAPLRCGAALAWCGAVALNRRRLGG